LLNNILQGVIQGLTEFLPVSSSGHLTVFQHFTGNTSFEANLFTDIALHLGTLIAVIYYFRKDLLPFLTIKGWQDKANRKLAFLIIAASIPTVAIGLGFEKQFEKLFSSPSLVALAFIITGIILLASEKLKSKNSENELASLAELSYKKAALIGIVQGLAVTPGISRSGSTIAAGLFCNLKGEDSARFSFLLMIPAVGGVSLLHTIKAFKQGIPPGIDSMGLLIGVIVSAIVGLLSLKFLVYIIKKQKLSYFSYYLFAISASILASIHLLGY
jgi:undecaprenyl-diphosphatase